MRTAYIAFLTDETHSSLQGVIRAMDTVQDMLSILGIADVTSFMIAGESKRGWTTWMTAPVDDRIVAMSPVVLSSLNMQEVKTVILNKKTLVWFELMQGASNTDKWLFV